MSRIVQPEVRVGINEPKPTHDLSLNVGERAFGLMLSKKWRGLGQSPRTPTTVLLKGGRGGQWGDHDPDFAHIQQSTWIGGMMQEEFSVDPTRYFHARNAFTLIPGRLIPTFRYLFSDGVYRDYNENPIDGNMGWYALSDSVIGQHSSQIFTVDAVDASSYDAAAVYLWLRMVGTPTALTVSIYTDDGSDDPDAIIAGATKSVAYTDIADSVAVYHRFALGTPPTLAHGTKYHIVVSAAGDEENHWEIGVDPDGTGMQYAKSGMSAWYAPATEDLHFRVVDADTAVKWHYFMLGTDELYKISEPASGTSELFVWDETNDEWDALTLKTGDDAVNGIVKSIAVSKGLAHMACGTEPADPMIYVFYHDGTDYRGLNDDTAGNKADHILAARDQTDGPQIVRAENDNWYLSRSDVKAFGTDLDFGDDIEFPQDFDIIALRYYNDQVWVRTVDGVWSVKNDIPARLGVGLDTVFETEGFVPLIDKDLFLLIGWDYSVERMYGSTLDDVGPWRNAGLPEEYQGRVAAMCSGIGVTFMAIDGGADNYSSVVAFDGQGYHPIFNGPEKGQRIRNVFWQPVSGAGGRLWISYGGDSIYMTFPQRTLNPMHDSNMHYHHEAVVETSTFTMDAERLKKFFKKLDFITERLGPSANIAVDYKIDQDIGDSSQSWTDVTTLYDSPLDEVLLNLGNKHRIRFRFRIRTYDSDKPATVIATILDCFARTPYKRVWTLRIKLGGESYTGEQDHNPYDLYEWLEEMSMSAEGVMMRANDHMMDGVLVLVEPPSLIRRTVNWLERKFTGWATFTLKEC